MGAYALRRLLAMIPVFLGATLIIFLVTHLVPGDPVRLLSGQRALDPVRTETIRHQLWLDRPLHVQYLHYLDGVVHGDLGLSYQRGRPVADILGEKFPNTARLALAAVFLEVIIGVAAGIIAAVRKASFLDTLVTVSTSLLVALPVFWLGLLLQLLFGVALGILPVSGMGDGGLQYYILPSFTLASVSAAYVARLMRSQLLETMGEDFVRTARAKGLSERQAVGRHALRAAILPVLTFVAVDLGALLGGAVLTETVFNWPGIGYEIVLAIGQRDYPIVIGGAIFLVLVFLLINLVVDILYGVIDPRIRLRAREVS